MPIKGSPRTVSVIVPTYNRAQVLERALRSILEQTHAASEIIVVDDGSSDGTRNVVSELAHPALRYVRHTENRGVAAARNTGLRHARGTFVAFLDSDDVWKPTMIEQSARFLSANPDVDAVFGDVEIVEGEEGQPWTHSVTRLGRVFAQFVSSDRASEPLIIPSRQMYLCLLEEVPVKPTVLVVRRRAFSGTGLFNEEWRSAEDWEMLLRLSHVTAFGYIDSVLATQYHLADATHRLFRESDQLSMLRLFMAERRRVVGDSDATSAVRRGLAGTSRDLGWLYKMDGRRKDALRTYVRGGCASRDPALFMRAAIVWAPPGVSRLARRARSLLRKDVGRGYFESNGPGDKSVAGHT